MSYTSEKIKFEFYTNGNNGHTPYIGDNGNWWINGQDLGIKAQGSDGDSFDKIEEYYYATLSTDLDKNEKPNPPVWNNGTNWESKSQDTKFGQKDDKGFTYKYLWNVEKVYTKDAAGNSIPVETDPVLIQIYLGGRIPEDYISYYAANTSSDTPFGQPVLDEDNNSIVLPEESVWDSGENYTGEVDQNNYLFEITFIKYAETDENGKNLYAKLSGPTMIGRNGADSTTLELDNDSDVFVIGKDGKKVSASVTVTARVLEKGSPLADATPELINKPDGFIENTHYTINGSTLTITSIPDGFEKGNFVFEYKDLFKTFTLKAITSNVDYDFDIAKTVINPKEKGDIVVKVRKTTETGEVSILDNSTEVFLYKDDNELLPENDWTISYDKGNTTPIKLTLKDSADFIWDEEIIEFVADGEEGGSIVANVVRDQYTEDNWNEYGAIGYNGWYDAARNGCRIGDLFTVTGTAIDTGNGHMLTYKSTTNEGYLQGVCLSHVINEALVKHELSVTPTELITAIGAEVSVQIHKTTGSITTNITSADDLKKLSYKLTAKENEVITTSDWFNYDDIADSYKPTYNESTKEIILTNDNAYIVSLDIRYEIVEGAYIYATVTKRAEDGLIGPTIATLSLYKGFQIYQRDWNSDDFPFNDSNSNNDFNLNGWSEDKPSVSDTTPYIYNIDIELLIVYNSNDINNDFTVVVGNHSTPVLVEALDTQNPSISPSAYAQILSLTDGGNLDGFKTTTYKDGTTDKGLIYSNALWVQNEGLDLIKAMGNTVGLAGWTINGQALEYNGNTDAERMILSPVGWSNGGKNWTIRVGENFGVTAGGILHASGGVFEGTINATGGTIDGNLSITNKGILSIGDVKICSQSEQSIKKSWIETTKNGQLFIGSEGGGYIEMIGPEAEEITKEGVEIFLTVKIRATFTGFYWNFFMDLSVDTKDNSFLSHDYTKNFFITISCGAANQTEECMTTIGSGEQSGTVKHKNSTGTSWSTDSISISDSLVEEFFGGSWDGMEFPEGMNIRFCFGQAPDQDGITLIIKQDKTSSGYIKLDTLSAVKPIYIHGDLTPTSNDCSLGSYNKYYSHIYCPLGDLVSLYEDLLHRIWNLEQKI